MKPNPDFFESCKSLNILIVGDVMLDIYLNGSEDRMSAEAPVPVVLIKSEDQHLGGAANVAMNVKAMGAKPIVCTIAGLDVEGNQMEELMKQEQLDTSGIIFSKKRRTTVKTRITKNNREQMIRIDREQTDDLQPEEETQLIDRVKKIISSQHIDAIIFQDYNKGVLTEKVIREVSALAKGKNILLTADPKKKNFFAYQNMSLFKPNLRELQEALEINIAPEQNSLDQASQQLFEKIHFDNLLITLSEHGVYFSEKGKKGKIITAHKRNISDVSGAGDTVISVATLALAAGLRTADAFELANLSGGMVCEEPGVVPVNPDRLKREWEKR